MDNQIRFIAEFACIHEGDSDYLLQLAKAIKDSGATDVKFQIFDASESLDPDHPDFAYLQSISFPFEAWKQNIEACSALGLGVWVDVSSRFSIRVVEECKQHIAGVKIHSADIDNPIVREGVQRLGLPVAIGCGGTPLVDLFDLLDQLGPDLPITLLHGYQAFPKLEDAPGGPPAKGVERSDLELWRIRQLAETFPMAAIGISEHLSGDHPLAIQAPALAVALGATVVEKHVTIERSTLREDYFSSIEPAQFAEMVHAVEDVLGAIGNDERAMGEGEHGYRREMKRTATVVTPIPMGGKIDPPTIAFIRDGSYETSARAGRTVGRRSTRALGTGSTITNAKLDMKVGLFCNARRASSRLPSKATKPFFGDLTTLGYLLTRLTSYPGEIGEIVFATTHLPEDDELEAIARDVGVPVIRGEVEDVMGRMLRAADAHNWDTLVRVTGDDQLVSCEYIERAVKHHLEKSLDFTKVEGLPLGMACEVIDIQTLRHIHNAVTNLAQTEQLTWYLDSEWICRTGAIHADAEHNYPQFRVTLDYDQDYDLMREVARRAHAKQPDFYLPIERIIETLIEIDPTWLHLDELWPFKRRQIHTGLVYQPDGR
jgi:N,N'-diacetyllegionaminate synthase